MRTSQNAVKPKFAEALNGEIRKEEIRPLAAEQVKALIEVMRGDRLEALYILAAHTGMRQGELLGLK